MPMLKLKKLSKTYTEGKNVETHAVRHIDLEIKKGEFVVVSGPSGSGKTTLLNLIGGLDAPTSGTIMFNAFKISHLKEKDLAHVRLHNIGFIFQAYNLVPVLTAKENIEYIMTLQKVAPKIRNERIEKIAHHLGIYNLLHKKPNELSGGQQQRIAVARAIVSKPKLILADEPTANLDTHNSETLLDLMKKLNEEEKVTFIFSTHDPVLIEKAKRNIILKDGKIDKDITV